jgi:hypothetical protein
VIGNLLHLLEQTHCLTDFVIVKFVWIRGEKFCYLLSIWPGDGLSADLQVGIISVY